MHDPAKTAVGRTVTLAGIALAGIVLIWKATRSETAPPDPSGERRSAAVDDDKGRVAKQDDKHHPAVIELEGIDSPCPAAQVPPLKVKVSPTRQFASLIMRAEASGALAMRAPQRPAPTTRPATIPAVVQKWGDVPRDAVRAVDLPLACLDDRETGRLTITVEGRDAAGEVVATVVLEVNGYVAGDKLYYGPHSLVTLMQAQILGLERAGLISAEESLRRRRRLTTIREGAAVPAATQPVGGRGAAPPDGKSDTP